MQLLLTPEAISAEFKRLIKAYDHFDWAVAWASNNFPAFKLLTRHRAKIRRVVVGTQFHQTHPDFISEFLKDPNVRFRLDDDGLTGVFHPKVYLFSDSATSWETIIGSPNFTKAAFTRNIECAVLLGSEDTATAPLYEDLLRQIETLWDSGSQVDQQKLAAYRVRWDANKRRLAAAKGFAARKIRTRNIYDCPILNLEWPQYFHQLQQNGNYFQERLDMLDATRTIFSQRQSLSAMSPEERKQIAGIAADGAIQWRLFGSMAGALPFKGRIRDNNQFISEALDLIPSKGPVTESHFEQYLARFRLAFHYGKPYRGPAVLTRLPCIKRPDYFICLDKMNTRLFEALGLRRRGVTVDNYWSTVVRPLLDSPWWNIPQPTDPDQLAAWDARIAMLDALYYEP